VHEVSIVEALIEQVESAVARADSAGRVTRLDVEIGRLSGVNADSIRFAYELLSPGTRLEGAEMRIEEPGAICVCEACGARSEIDELVFDCPACGGEQVALEGGDQMLLRSIEVDEG
jgi:hydrogenase nickel incorporation protein HypA/HybF